MIGLEHFLILSAVLFAIGLYGSLTRRNAIAVLMSIELMLNAVNINLIAAASHLDHQAFTGQIIARVKEAIVTELIATIDYMKMFEQLGQLPEDSLPICLTGEQLIWAQ